MTECPQFWPQFVSGLAGALTGGLVTWGVAAWSFKKQRVAQARFLQDERISDVCERRQRDYRNMLVELGQAFEDIAGLRQPRPPEKLLRWKDAYLLASMYDEPHLKTVLKKAWIVLDEEELPPEKRRPRVEYGQLVESTKILMWEFVRSRLRVLDQLSPPPAVLHLPLEFLPLVVSGSPLVVNGSAVDRPERSADVPEAGENQETQDDQGAQRAANDE